MSSAETVRPPRRPPSEILLTDPARVRVDDGPRSRAYFCAREPLRVTQGLVNQLKAVAEELGERNVRVCLHDSPSASFHEMIIVERRGKYYRPHKHLTKGESYHIMEGSMAACLFDEQGRIVDVCVLGAGGNLVYRVGPNMSHAILPLSEWIIYHESKPGPFLGDQDSIFPSWAPDGTNAEEVTAFTARVRQAIEAQ